MAALLFYIFPVVAIAVGGPLWLAIRNKDAMTFFKAQFLTVGGVLLAIALLNRGIFGAVGIAGGAAVLSLCAFVGLVVAYAISRRRR